MDQTGIVVNKGYWNKQSMLFMVNACEINSNTTTQNVEQVFFGLNKPIVLLFVFIPKKNRIC